MESNVISIGDEQAKAVQEASKALGKALDIPLGLGAFVKETLGTLPKNLVGLLDDRVIAIRARNLRRTLDEMLEHQKRRRVKDTIEVSPSVAIPLLENAATESRAELRDVWARLRAAASDPARANGVRASYIDAVKAMDPLDALVMPKIRIDINCEEGFPTYVGRMLSVTADEVFVSLQNLERLGLCTNGRGDFRTVGLTVKGRELMRVLAG